MVIGHHLIWTAYGCWLPNDPRGSSSHVLREDRLAPLGELHEGRKQQQPSRAELKGFYQQADVLLAHERLPFDDDEIALIGFSYAQTVRRYGYTCYACAIMP